MSRHTHESLNEQQHMVMHLMADAAEGIPDDVPPGITAEAFAAIGVTFARYAGVTKADYLAAIATYWDGCDEDDPHNAFGETRQ